MHYREETQGNSVLDHRLKRRIRARRPIGARKLRIGIWRNDECVRCIFRLWWPGSPDEDSSERRAFKLNPRQRGARQLRAAEIGTRQLRVAEISGLQLGGTEIGGLQPGVTEIGTR